MADETTAAAAPEEKKFEYTWKPPQKKVRLALNYNKRGSNRRYIGTEQALPAG